MPPAIGQRQRGQAIVMAAVAMVAIVGALAMVIDVGMFLVVQRQFQSAADAAALAGAWHAPICPNAVGYAPPCLTTPAAPPKVGAVLAGVSPWISCNVAPPVTNPPTLPNCARCDGPTGLYTACDVALANANGIKGLCGGFVEATVAFGTQLVRPRNVDTIVVTVECDAGYSFGRILDLTTKHLSASAAAALGDRDATNFPICGGDLTDLTSGAACGYIARLID